MPATSDEKRYLSASAPRTMVRTVGMSSVLNAAPERVGEQLLGDDARELIRIAQ